MPEKKQVLLEKVRQLNWLLQESPKGNLSFDGLCEKLSELLDSNVYLVDVDGVLLGTHFTVVEDSSTRTDPATEKLVLPEGYAEALLQVQEPMPNLKDDEVLKILKYEESTKQKYHTILPILGGGEHWGSMILARYNPKYDDEDLVLAEVSATVAGLEIRRHKKLEWEEDQRKEEMVEMALSTLSYSETEAVNRIFEELNAEEGILVASRVADKSRITRSVIVNALRKLESAGVIESKSLGMKGTHIKVLNDKFLEIIGLKK